MLDVLATEPHFAKHLRPVVASLNISTCFYENVALMDESNDPVLVAAFGDLLRARARGRTHIAIMEHGAGQSYGAFPNTFADYNGSYAGGLGRVAELFLHPGPHPAARDRARYRLARTEIVGSPRLDSLPALVPHDGLVVAVSFHWDCGVCAETRSSWAFFRHAVINLSRNIKVIGHAHPRIWDKMHVWYEDHGIELVSDFDEVCRRADVYVCDNSSTLFEFASLGRPVIVMNSPLYRKNINHGLRFWEASQIGLNVDNPDELTDITLLASRGYGAEEREAALDMVYAYRHGAADRAARVLEDWALNTAKVTTWA